MQGTGVTILVVEDEQLIRDMVADALSDGGFEAEVAVSGEDAVSLLQGQPNQVSRTRYRYKFVRKARWLASRPSRQGAKSGHLCDLHDRRGGRSMARPRRAQQHLADQAICTCANRDRRSSTSEYRNSARSVLRGVDEAFSDRGSLRVCT